MIAFTVLGEPMSLKNDLGIARGRVIHTREYKKWAADFALQIPREYKGLMLGSRKQLLRITCQVWYASWRKDVDMEGLYDVLQAANVISNDRWLRHKDVIGTTVDKKNPRIYVTIEVI